MNNLRHENVPLDLFVIRRGVPVLNENEIHVWFSELDADEHKLNYLQTLLSQEEIAKAQFFLEKKLQNNYVHARGVLKELLSAYCKIPKGKVDIRISDSGKPFLNNHKLYFNLTHSGNRFGIAVSKTSEVGLDIERVRSLHDFDQMISLNFTPAEQKYIDKKSAGFENRFFEMWTLKESYLKLTGEGMRRNPDTLEFCVINTSARLISVDGIQNTKTLNFVFIQSGAGYKATLAVNGNSSVVVSKIN